MGQAAGCVMATERGRLRRATLATLERLHGTYRSLQGQAERAGQQDAAIALAERAFLLEDRLARLRLDMDRE